MFTLLQNPIGLRSPYRFERLLVMLVALGFGIVVLGLAIQLIRAAYIRRGWREGY